MKKAVLIGCNYPNSQVELKNCINDAIAYSRLLTLRFGFSDSNMKLMLDDAKTNPPTRRNILREMKWLVFNAKKGDKLFLMFSGHGGQQKQEKQDEEDGQDEIMYPTDFEKCGSITDNEINSILVHDLPQGVKLTVVMDMCHSGTSLDLPYLYIPKNKSFIKNYAKQYPVDNESVLSKSSKGDVLFFSGCRDDQLSVDGGLFNAPVGAMTAAFLAILFRNPDVKISNLIESVLQLIPNQFNQWPQLSSARKIVFEDTNFL